MPRFLLLDTDDWSLKTSGYKYPDLQGSARYGQVVVEARRLIVFH